MKDDAFLAIATEHGLTMDEARVWLDARPEGFDMDTITPEVIRTVVTDSMPRVRQWRIDHPDKINEDA